GVPAALAQLGRHLHPAPVAGVAQPISSPNDRCVAGSHVLRPRVPPDSSPAGGAAASGEAHREPLVCVWRNPYPGCGNPSHSACRCSFSCSMLSGASSVIRVLLSAPWSLRFGILLFSPIDRENGNGALRVRKAKRHTVGKRRWAAARVGAARNASPGADR